MFEYPPQLISKSFKLYVESEFQSIDDCIKYLHSKGIYDFDCITFNGTFKHQSADCVIQPLD